MSNILLQLSRFLKLFFLLPILGGFVYVECAIAEPFVNDPKLKVELVASDLQFPTSMAFLGPDDILVLEKNNGTVQRIIDGVKQEDPILDVSVANKNERGMLGIASMIETAVENRTLQDPKKLVFLFYSEINNMNVSNDDGSDFCPTVTYCEQNTNPVGNRLYRYELNDDRLVNRKLLLDLPSAPGSDHIGGVIVVGPDNNIYILSGDGDSCFDEHNCLGNSKDSTVNSQTSNIHTGLPAQGRGGIIRVTPNGHLMNGNGILGEEHPLNLYYAYGIRNGFGLDFDPITEKLWDTENGPGFGDEINLVEPGFNSGWAKVQGVWPITEYNAEPLPAHKGYFGEDVIEEDNIADQEDFVEFNGKGKYSAPEFTWNASVGVTALKFLGSDGLGKQYENDLFVADYNNNYIYNFDLNESRTEFVLDDALSDKVANSNEELADIVFGGGLGVITDMEVGYDGYLYLLSHTEGAIYRIVPNN
jgi:glucose/arabinose dehydrogenase